MLDNMEIIEKKVTELVPYGNNLERLDFHTFQRTSLTLLFRLLDFYRREAELRHINRWILCRR